MLPKLVHGLVRNCQGMYFLLLTHVCAHYSEEYFENRIFLRSKQFWVLGWMYTFFGYPGIINHYIYNMLVFIIKDTGYQRFLVNTKYKHALFSTCNNSFRHRNSSFKITSPS